MKNKAINALIEMGMPADIKGFHYIVDAMCLFDEDDFWKKGKISCLYNKLAEMNDDKWALVERAIRHAFSIVLIKGNLEAVKKYLSLQKTTNGNLLATLFLKLSQEE